MKQSEINKRAKKLAEHANSSIGRIPLERVFEKHISFLEELRQFGATWAQIAQLLFTYGITQKSGNRLHPNQVRVSFVRAQEKSLAHCKTTSAITLQPQRISTERRLKASTTVNVKEPPQNSTQPSALNTSGKESEIRQRMSQSLKVRK